MSSRAGEGVGGLLGCRFVLERFLFLFTRRVFPVVHTPIRPAAAGPFDQCDQLEEELGRAQSKPTLAKDFRSANLIRRTVSHFLCRPHARCVHVLRPNQSMKVLNQGKSVWPSCFSPSAEWSRHCSARFWTRPPILGLIKFPLRCSRRV